MPIFRDDDRTEPATPKRREEAREKGQVAKSREIPSAFIILGGTLVIYFAGHYMQNRLLITTQRFLSQSGELKLTDTNLYHLGIFVIRDCTLTLLPILISLIVIGILSNYFQTGLLLSTKPLEPDLNRINPINGLKRIISLTAFVELFKSILKLLIIGFVSYKIIKSELPHLAILAAVPCHQIFAYTFKVAFKICFYTGLVLCVLSVFDYFYQRYEYEQNLKMTKQEVKEEFKEREGDPKIKGRIRRMQMEMVRKRMLQEVPKADVVITNPTHLAVALKYDYAKMVAPKVVAKGAGYLAQKIKEMAIQNGVVIVENKWLARTLYKTVEIDEYIPPMLYQAVAEILAYVYRLKERRVVG